MQLVLRKGENVCKEKAWPGTKHLRPKAVAPSGLKIQPQRCGKHRQDPSKLAGNGKHGGVLRPLRSMANLRTALFCLAKGQRQDGKANLRPPCPPCPCLPRQRGVVKAQGPIVPACILSEPVPATAARSTFGATRCFPLAPPANTVHSQGLEGKSPAARAEAPPCAPAFRPW